MDFKQIQIYIAVLTDAKDKTELEKIQKEYPHLFYGKYNQLEVKLFNQLYQKEIK